MHVYVLIWVFEQVPTRSKNKRDGRWRRVASVSEDASGYNNPPETCHKNRMASSGVVETQRPSETRYIAHIPFGRRRAA